MKKLLVLMMLLVCSVCTFSLELKTKETRREDRAARAKAKAQAKEKAKEEKQKQKTSAKEFEGQYLKATNTFYYVKDKLVLPNKKVTYTLNDQTGLIDTPGVTVQPQSSPEEVRILDIPSIGPNK